MLRALNQSVRSAGNHSSGRRRHHFVPSIGGAVSALEDRALLSGMSGMAAHAAAHPLANQSPPPNGSVGPIIAHSSENAAAIAYPNLPHHHHSHGGGKPVFEPYDGSIAPLVARPATSQTPPPNALSGPAAPGVVNPFTGTSPPNGSVGPIIA